MQYLLILKITFSLKVDLFISRDSDSDFNDREYAAVQEWLHSEKSIHVMRDHPRHSFPMLGGLWGTKLFMENIRSKWKNSWQNVLEDNIMWARKHDYGLDQDFLQR